MKFEYNPRIIEQLGTELITSDEVAFTELLKNSYDAKASQVRVHFIDSIKDLDESLLITPLNPKVLEEIKKSSRNEPLIVIEDDGSGMNKDRLKKGFFTVGSTLKEQLKKSEEDAGRMGKMTLGDKGLGRLSSQRLASTLIVETSSKDEKKHVNFVKIEWSKFSKNLDEEAIELEFSKLNTGSYTRLWFTGSVNFLKFIENKAASQYALFDNNDDKSDKIYLQEKLQSSVSFLYSPFEEKDDAFKIEFYWNSAKINSTLHNNSIHIAETIHSFLLYEDKTIPTLKLSLTLKPWFVELIHLRILGKNLFTEKKKNAQYYANILKKYESRLEKNLSRTYKLEAYLKERPYFNPVLKPSLEEIMPIEGKVYAFHREQFRLSLAVNAAKSLGEVKLNENITSIREFLNYHNGIKLYRDKFRIANLGDKDSDWLNLQQARTKGQQFFRFELGNVLGYVKINDFYQKYIKEISSRQELRQSPNATALKLFLQSVFNEDFYQLSSSAYYIIRDILYEEGLIPQSSPKELKDQIEESDLLLKETLKSLSTFKNSFNEIKDNIQLDSDDKIKKVQNIIKNLDGQDTVLAENINNSITTLNSAKEKLTVIEERQRESYNNYKLMANGLITEVMTHELHSILVNTKSGTDYTKHIESIKSYLLEMKQIGIFKDDLKPISERLDFLHIRISDLDLFYNFLEKTFIRQGTRDDFEHEYIEELIFDFNKRLGKRIKELKTKINCFELEKYTWYVPKGTLTHVFYNLIDNSLHWIGERQKRSAYDAEYKTDIPDSIVLQRIDENTLHYYDSGTGIVNEMEDVLFYPLKSGKKNGRGMGMYIVKNLLESFGGTIELLPELNIFGNRYIFSISINSNEQG